MGFEFGPFVVGDGPILLGWPDRPPPLQVRLVVAGDVLFEYRDIAARGFQVQMPKQRGTDVDGQTVVNQVSGEQATKVVRTEMDSFKTGIGQGDVLAEVPEFFGDAPVVITSKCWPMRR